MRIQPDDLFIREAWVRQPLTDDTFKRCMASGMLEILVSKTKKVTKDYHENATDRYVSSLSVTRLSRASHVTEEERKDMTKILNSEPGNVLMLTYAKLCRRYNGGRNIGFYTPPLNGAKVFPVDLFLFTLEHDRKRISPFWYADFVEEAGDRFGVYPVLDGEGVKYYTRKQVNSIVEGLESLKVNDK